MSVIYYRTYSAKKHRADTFRSAMDIAEEVVDTHIEQSDFDLPSHGLLARRANYARRTLRPPEPRGEDFDLIIDALPPDYLRHDIKTEGARHIIFSTDRQLECLNGAKQWYVDGGTFKVLRKRDPFQQLFTIHAFLTNEIGESKQVPLLFVFMSKRRKRDYKKVFKKVKTLLPAPKLQVVVLDYERAAWSALRKVFPGVTMTGCAFHWSQAVWRKVQTLGLSTSYRTDDGTYRLVGKLLALPLIPEEHITETFEKIREQASQPLHPLIEYVNSTWIDGGMWGPSDICVYGRSVRTNNDCEGWHRRLNFKIERPPPFYDLIKQLHTESQKLSLQMKLISERKLKKQQKRSTKIMQRKIFDAWTSYENSEIFTSQLITKLSDIYRPQL